MSSHGQKIRLTRSFAAGNAVQVAGKQLADFSCHRFLRASKFRRVSFVSRLQRSRYASSPPSLRNGGRCAGGASVIAVSPVIATPTSVEGARDAAVHLSALVNPIGAFEPVLQKAL